MRKTPGSRQLTQHINHRKRLRAQRITEIPVASESIEFVRLHQKLYPVYGEKFVALYQERIAPDMLDRSWTESLALLKEIEGELEEGGTG